MVRLPSLRRSRSASAATNAVTPRENFRSLERRRGVGGAPATAAPAGARPGAAADLPPGTTFDEWGIGHWAGGAEDTCERMFPPLAGELDAARIRDLPEPVVAPSDEGGTESVAGRVAAFHDRGYPVAGYAGSIYEWSWWLRGMEQFLVDLLEHPDAIFFLHSCGDITPVVEDVVEIGSHVLQPVQPECMDATLIKKRFGDRIVPCATLGAQRTLARGTPDEVAAETTRLLDTLGADRRCLVCPSNRIQPETPWENVLAFERAARAHPLGGRSRDPLRGSLPRQGALRRPLAKRG